MAPVISSSAPKVSEPAPRAAAPADRHGAAEKPRRSPGSRSGVKVRKLERGAEDGYVSGLVQGLKSSADAERLAYELAFAATRLLALAASPPGVYAEIASGPGDLEERTWLAVQVALDPSGERVPWSVGPWPEAYRNWVARAGSQAAAFSGESYWTPERRFERVFERLGSVAVMDRDRRFDLLVTLGRLGLYELEAGKLFFGGENETTWAGKRALGIGDPLLLERRALDLATACGIPLAALDLGLHNWGTGSGVERIAPGVDPSLEPDPQVLAGVRDALGL